MNIPKFVASMISEEIDVRLELLLETVEAQQIYDFYAIADSGLKEEFRFMIRDLAKELYQEIRELIVERLSAPFLEYGICPTLTTFVRFGGKPSAWKKFRKFIPTLGPSARHSGMRIVDSDNVDYEGLKTIDLTDAEIESIWKYLKHNDALMVSGDGAWTKIWRTIQDVNLDGSASDLIVSVDRMLGLLHHGGNLLSDYGSEGVAQALDDKAAAQSVRDFWDKVSPGIQKMINQMRASRMKSRHYTGH